MLPTLSIAAVLAFGGPTVPPGGESAPRPSCMPLADFKVDSRSDPSTHLFKLTAGQFHFVEGLYVGSPATPPGLPPGDSALLAMRDGEHGGVIVWTRGTQVCAPIPIDEKLVRLISSIKTGKHEELPDELPRQQPKANSSADCRKRNLDECSF